MWTKARWLRVAVGVVLPLLCSVLPAPAQPVEEATTRQGLLLAQRQAKSRTLTPEQVTDWERRVHWWENSRLRLNEIRTVGQG